LPEELVEHPKPDAVREVVVLLVGQLQPQRARAILDCRIDISAGPNT
jgi:hypothetical protein